MSVVKLPHQLPRMLAPVRVHVADGHDLDVAPEEIVQELPVLRPHADERHVMRLLGPGSAARIRDGRMSGAAAAAAARPRKRRRVMFMKRSFG
jgi:hypothetical protein